MKKKLAAQHPARSHLKESDDFERADNNQMLPEEASTSDFVDTIRRDMSMNMAGGERKSIESDDDALMYVKNRVGSYGSQQILSDNI